LAGSRYFWFLAVLGWMEPFQTDFELQDRNEAKRLWLEVLGQAVRDAIEPTSCYGQSPEAIQSDAIDFIFSRRSDFIFTIIGVDQGWGRVGIIRRLLEATSDDFREEF
jgi:hypothetical protein